VSTRRLALALAALLALAASAAGARGRIVAVGDVHGGYAPLLTLLTSAGITDASGHWTGGDATLVQVGDIVDRGPDERRVLDLLMALEHEADEAGGRVVVVLGNHEFMTILGDWRYASSAAIADFGGIDARRAAFAPKSIYGRWLRRRPAIIALDGTVFVHGGVAPEVATLGVAGIRERVRQEIQRYDAARERALRRGRLAPSANLEALRALRPPELATFDNWLIAHKDGPFWFRGYDKWSDAEVAERLPRILAQLGARRIVVGHSVQLPAQIRSRAGGKLLLIDTGMLGPPLYPGGAPMALELVEGGVQVIDATGARAPLAGLASDSEKPALGTPPAAAPILPGG
jgi:hypothetical protein